MKEVYAVRDRHIRYATTKASKMAEGSSVHSREIKMLSLMEKLEDLKAGLNNDTYIDVILQSLPPSYDPFIINYDMNGLEKFINELINMLVQYEATTHKSTLAVLVGEASTSKAKGKRVGRWKRKKGKGKAVATTTSAKGAPGISLTLVISNHIRITLKDCYYISSMIKIIISIPVLDNDGYAFAINKNSFI
ncbi:UNVERIFIED_CONTAM: hypothetical protein Slati_2975700 [Sesamum latifolium]|uniref:Uncharacterized protein n=1 Tax=Sesamum latifolium TaxID=2727402 RepID=A0AAW2VGA5_9LAMI